MEVGMDEGHYSVCMPATYSTHPPMLQCVCEQDPP